MSQNSAKYWLGKHLSQETKKKLSESKKRDGIKPPLRKGIKHSEETKRRISQKLKGRIIPEEIRRKMSKFLTGHIGYWRGKKLSKEHRRKMSIAHKEKKKSEEHRKNISLAKIGNKNPSWRGGKSFEPYTTDWTETLRKAIRERDHYVCQLCNQYGNVIHHIDYDKKNCNPENLINLCQKCNSKVNFNRKYWKDYFIAKENAENRLRSEK